MKQVMVCLIGEQPVPNLLPIRHCQPQQVILVYSTTTKRVSDNLERLLKGKFVVLSHEVPPYDIVAAQKNLAEYLSQRNLQGTNLLFNLTGGTKPMSLAAFRLAQEQSVSVVYLQSEGGQSLLYRYEFDKGGLVLRERTVIGELLTIDDYLKAHVGKYQQRRQKDDFEQLVLNALQPHVSEIISGVSIGANIELDLTIRCGNQVGVAEVTTGEASKRKIDQLNSASRREFLGIYTKRFLIISQTLESNNRLLAEAYNIIVIELLGDSSSGLSEENRKRLVEAVTKELGGTP